ncbi:hypothetical protein KM043_014726 [Ampulex compressa]|nr:hypothetical protein KM043_014726 [Ampulex compressa]
MTDAKYIRNIKNGPSLRDFIMQKDTPALNTMQMESIPYIKEIPYQNQNVYFEIYGCQMNINDVEVIWSILKTHGYKKTNDLSKADIVLIVTCAIREGAEQKVWNKMQLFNALKKKKEHMKIGLLGCMAERLKDKVLEKEKTIDVIAGPDSYKDLPRLLAVTDKEVAINVLLSLDETYADIRPVRLDQNSVSAYVSIMRGCDNMCTYCIVPFTRGRERSRPIESIIDEIQSLSDEGVKEVTLLGQNVNSYRDLSQSDFYMPSDTETQLAKGFKTVYKKKKGGRRFSDLLDKVSRVNPEMRIRFTSAHPKDFPDEVLHLIAERPNICNQLHLPAQSGNSLVLERMRRGYTREAYIDLVHHETLSLMELIKYNKAFMYAYSMREKTTAHRRSKAEQINKSYIGQYQLVQVERKSKRSAKRFQTKNDGNTTVIIPSMDIPIGKNANETEPIKIGDYILVHIDDANSEILHGTPLHHSSIADYSSINEKC